MSKIIKFPLILKNDVQARSIEELREHFDLMKATAYFLNGKLQTWLEQRYYDSEAAAIKLLKDSDPDFHKKLCEILGAEYKEEDVKVDINLVKERDRRLNELKQYTSDQSVLDKIDQVAFNQEELAYLLDEGVHDIYLCNNSFSIPIRIPNKKYIGIGKAVAVIHSDWEVDFWTKRIEFVSVEFNPEYEEICNPTPEKLYQMGRKAEKQQCYQRADAYYRRGMKLDSNKAKIRLVERGKASHEILKKMAVSGDVDAMYALGVIYYGDGDISNAEKWFREAISKGKGSHHAMLDLATSPGFNLSEDEKVKLLEKSSDDGNPRPMFVLANIFLGNQDWPKFRYWIIKAISNGETSLYSLTRDDFILTNKDNEECAATVLNLWEKNSNNATCGEMIYAAQVYHRLNREGDFDKALKCISKALDVVGDDIFQLAPLYDTLGDIYKENGFFEKAIKAYKKACDVYPTLLGEKGYYGEDEIHGKIDFCKSRIESV